MTGPISHVVATLRWPSAHVHVRSWDSASRNRAAASSAQLVSPAKGMCLLDLDLFATGSTTADTLCGGERHLKGDRRHDSIDVRNSR